MFSGVVVLSSVAVTLRSSHVGLNWFIGQFEG